MGPCCAGGDFPVQILAGWCHAILVLCWVFMKNRAGYGMLEDSVLSGYGGLRSWLGALSFFFVSCDLPLEFVIEIYHI